jgi:hypothetical protein
MVVGSFASTVYGEPRLTLDIDIVVDLELSQVGALCAAFPSSEFYVSLPAAEDAVRRRKQFNLIHPASGNKIDFMIARLDQWGRQQLQRRRKREFLPGVSAWAASPEDVIVAKMIYYREGQSPKHTRDIAGMLRISAAEIDQTYISEWSERLGLSEIWESILRELRDRANSDDSL